MRDLPSIQYDFFLDFDIGHRMQHCECCDLWPWPKFSRSKIVDAVISETVRASANKASYDFYRGWYTQSNGIIVNLVLHDLTWPSFAKSTISCYVFAIKILQHSDCPRRICLDPHGHRGGVALVPIDSTVLHRRVWMYYVCVYRIQASYIIS